MNILFLDFDGVINNNNVLTSDFLVYNPSTNNTNTMCGYNKLPCSFINKLCQKFNFKIVISSSWREDFTIPELQSILNKQLQIEAEILDFTSKSFLDTSYLFNLRNNPNTVCNNRGLQISDWLSEKKYNVNYYFILDDDEGAFFNHNSKNFYKVNPNTAFNKNAYDEVVEQITSFI